MRILGKLHLNFVLFLFSYVEFKFMVFFLFLVGCLTFMILVIFGFLNLDGFHYVVSSFIWLNNIFENFGF